MQGNISTPGNLSESWGLTATSQIRDFSARSRLPCFRRSPGTSCRFVSLNQPLAACLSSPALSDSFGEEETRQASLPQEGSNAAKQNVLGEAEREGTR